VCIILSRTKATARSAAARAKSATITKAHAKEITMGVEFEDDDEEEIAKEEAAQLEEDADFDA
jgi:hypothetical protein